MPLWDCGHPDCDECIRAFGPDRSDATRRFERRRACMEALATANPPPPLQQERA